MTTRILILMSDTGGGHRASAEALRDAFAVRYGDAFAVEIVDLWRKYAPWPLDQVPKTYRFLTDDIPWFYAGAFRLGEHRAFTRVLLRAVAVWVDGRVMQALHTYRPDLIISVHPLLQEIPLSIMARHGMRLPWVTVVTDLASIHPTWFTPAATLCFVPTPAAYEQALRAGLRSDQVRVSGLPIRRAFAQPPQPKEALRHALGLEPQQPAVLLMGGGEGMGPLRAIAEAIAGQLAAYGRGQLVVICGRNSRLQAELAGLAWPAPVRICGFVDNMADWMAACDCLVTKAGPGTIAEAMASGLPLVLTSFIPGQETGNVTYVVENGIGVYAPQPHQVADVVGRWLGPEQAELAKRADRARQLAQPHAASYIVEHIARLCAQDEPYAGLAQTDG